MTQAASQGGSSAPSASPQGQGTPTASQGGDAAGFDVTHAMQEARRARGETQSLRSNFDKRFSAMDEDLATVRKLRETFAPPAPKTADPVQHLEEQMDYYLEQAMEAKAKGVPMPLTTNLAIQSFQNLVALHNQVAEFKKEIAELKSGVNQANDPQAPINNMAYATMETFLQSAIDGMYGDNPASTPIRSSIYKAAVDMIGANLKELQTKAPAQWDRVRRNTNELQKIVNSAIRQLVPPKAMELMQHDELQNTPMQEGELWAAFREADTIKDANERRRVRTAIRQDILELQANRNRRQPRRG